MIEKEVLSAIKVACQLERSQNALAKKIGTSQTTINNIINGKSKIGNISIDTLIKIFPKMEIDYFGSKNDDNSITSQIINILAYCNDKELFETLILISSKFPEAAQKAIKHVEDTANEKSA